MTGTTLSERETANVAKSHRRSNREAKKPKKTAAEKPRPSDPIASRIAGGTAIGTSYKDRFK